MREGAAWLVQASWIAKSMYLLLQCRSSVCNEGSEFEMAEVRS